MERFMAVSVRLQRMENWELLKIQFQEAREMTGCSLRCPAEIKFTAFITHVRMTVNQE